MYLIISNKGLVEPGALSLMGASVKDGEAIGKFGSGFKYALATLLREGFALRIFSGETELVLETRPEVFRDTVFQVLWIDGVRTSITTRTGVEWKPRDAIREIYSNALDEGDAEWNVEASILPRPGYTTIAVECKGEIFDMTESWEMYFSRFVKEIHANSYGRIIPQRVVNYFRRGIWICEDRDTMGLYSYDFNDIDLPESRKIDSSATSYYVYLTLSACNDKDVWRKVMGNAESNCMEWYAMSRWGMMGIGRDTAQAVFAEKYDYYGNSKFRDRIGETKHRVLWVSEKRVYCFEKLGLKNITTAVDFTEKYNVVPWPIGLRDKLDAPLAILKANGIDMTKFRIWFVDYLEDNPPIAFAHKNQCFLTAQAFEVNQTTLLKSLIEEWTHLEHNVADHTVAQQHVYLDLIVSLMKKGGE